MRKIFLLGLLIFPNLVFANPGTDTLDTDITTVITMDPLNYILAGSKGDTIVNLNSLNNGIVRYQVSEESIKIMGANGLEIKEGGIVVVAMDTLLKKDFSFDVKTFASDKEWYENTIKIKVKRIGNTGRISLINVTSDKIEMATGFRKEGKIYVVISVSMILFGVVIFYLIYLERKTRKLEKQLKGK